MKFDEIIAETKSYFGKNRRKLKTRLMSCVFDGRHYRNWRKKMKSLTLQPFYLGFGIFDDVADHLIAKNYKEIDWKWLGDLSWEIKILLNENIEKGLDWDKKLSMKCGGTSRILQIYVSDVIPCFVVEIYYMTYNKKENYYEFGAINTLTKTEKELVQTVTNFLKQNGFTFLPKHIATKKIKGLYSDCNDGNASIYEALFSDTDAYQTEIKRFNDKEIKDYNNLKVNWTEFYDKNRNLLKREEFRYLPSKNVLCTITNGNHEVMEIKVTKAIKNHTHWAFKFDLVKEERKKLRKDESKKRS
jgi:hypothetical protein